MASNDLVASRLKHIQDVVAKYACGRPFSFFESCPELDRQGISRFRFGDIVKGKRAVDIEMNVRLNHVLASWLAERNILHEGFLDLYTEESLSRLKELVLKGAK